MQELIDGASSCVKSKILGLYGVLLVFNVGTWLWAFLVFRHYPVLFGTAFLAYSFGLRHAVDADHIAAIDNVTRKLMQEGKKPVAVGFMFSLGHSTVVFVGAALISSAASVLQHRLEAVRSMGGFIGTLISTVFLFSIAIANIVVLRSVYRVFARVRNGAPYVEEDLDLLLADRGFLARLFRPMFAIIQQSWHMYPLGFLFGMGFDTATEIGLLSISASEASKGLPFASTLVFPALFAAGMSLVDTTDNILMLGAYGWAFIKPVRKLYYNLTVTLTSIVVAMVVGGVEALGLFAGQFRLDGIFWDTVRKLNSNFGTLGYLIIGFFVLSWFLSILFYKWQRLDDLEIQA